MVSLALYDVSKLTAQIAVDEYVKSCVDVPRFLACCRECPNYGKIWACPPLSFDPMEIWNAYKTMTLYARVLTPRENISMEKFMDVFMQEKISLSREVLDLEKEAPGSLSMAASTCVVCSPCARACGKPCRHPEQVRYSMEALGGDVGMTMGKYLHMPLHWSRNGEIPPYLVAVAGLLEK